MHHVVHCQQITMTTRQVTFVRYSLLAGLVDGIPLSDDQFVWLVRFTNAREEAVGLLTSQLSSNGNMLCLYALKNSSTRSLETVYRVEHDRQQF
jgi:hypothetical protein